MKLTDRQAKTIAAALNELSGGALAGRSVIACAEGNVDTEPYRGPGALSIEGPALRADQRRVVVRFADEPPWTTAGVHAHFDRP